MKRIAEIWRREGSATIAREAVWRTTKALRSARFRASIEEIRCPVRFRPMGYYRPQLAECGEQYRESLARYADAICAGEFPFFFSGPAKLGFPPQWNLDFVSGMTWPQEPSERLIVVRHDGSDVKTPWELSRLQFLPVLGKAWRLTRNEHYRRAAMELTADWIEKNPVGVGVNWTIAMEAALRSLSICLLFELLWPIREEEQAQLEDMTRSLWQHFLYIEAHSEFSYLLRSNHYLSNIVGLLGLSSFLEGPGMDTRREHYARLVQQEILHQTYEDGGSHEASLGYHLLDTQMFTTALLLMRAFCLEIHPAFCERLRRMYGILAELCDSRGWLQHIGDCDDGRVELLADDLDQMFLPAPQRNSLVVSGLLGVGEALFNLPQKFRQDDAAWYCSAALDARVGGTVWRSNDLKVFPESGIARLQRGDLELLFFAIPNGIMGKGSHTHNDKLSIVLRFDGHELLCDSGTGCYTRDSEMRNRFRSTAAHNTVRVDKEEQNRIPHAKSELFRLGNEAEVTPIEIQCAGELVSLRASHFGYSNFGVTHTRTVTLAGESSLRIEDLLDGTGEHEIEFFFHLAVPWRVQRFEGAGKFIRCHLDGPRPVEISWSAPAELEAVQGPWQLSRAFGTAFDSVRIRVRAQAHLPLLAVTHIGWAE